MDLHLQNERAVPGFMKSLVSAGRSALLLGVVSTLVACGGGSSGSTGDGTLLGDNNGGGDTTPVITVTTTDGGVTEQDDDVGTPCSNPGASASCHAVIKDIDGFKDCSGTHTCDADSGVWTECVSTLVVSSVDSVDGG